MTAINCEAAQPAGLLRPANPEVTAASNQNLKNNREATRSHRVLPHGVHVAQRIDQVERAWQLVHDAYSQQGLINPNENKIHTVLEAIHPTTSVIVQEEHGETVSTLTIMQDRKRGLPLDCIYPIELGKLRSTGRRLLEIGLLAETASKRGSSARGIIEMMRHVFWFAWHHKSYILAGVHPKHAGFYCRYFGFEVIGDEATHPTVNHRPVVPLCCPLDQMLASPPWPKGVNAFVQAPMPLQAFNHRVRLTDEGVSKSRIGRYLEDRADRLAIRAA